jgi:hypothetical protein
MPRSVAIFGVAVVVLIAAVASSAVAETDVAPGVTPAEGFPASKGALEAATADAIPVAMPGTAPIASSPGELPDLNRPEAEDVLEEVFGSAIEGSAQALDELDVEEFRSDHVAVVAAPEGSGSAGLVSSVLPLRAENETGEKKAIDLDLEQVDGHLEPENPLVPVEVPLELSDGISFPGTKISIGLESDEAQRGSSLVGDASAFYPNVAADSDFIVTPTVFGAETYMQLRSPASPRTQVFQLAVPDGYNLRKTDNGGAKVVDAVGDPVLTVAPPFALDGEGQQVPATLEVSGMSMSVSVQPGEDVAYPILVDPVFERYDFSVAPEVGCMCDWSQASNPGFGTEMTSGTRRGLTARAEQGPTSPGNQAFWQYYVPRYWKDIQEGQPAPTTYIRNMKLWYLTYMMPMESAPYTAYPFMQMGLWSDNKQAYVSYGYRDGTEGQATDGNWVYGLKNPDEVTDIKHGGFAIATWNSWNNAHRYVNAQQASVEVTDKDSPAFGELGSVASWLSSASGPAINYKVSDPGLGVRELRLSYPAASGGRDESITPVKFTNMYINCNGSAINPCPRTVSQAKTPISYNPAQIAQGENWARVYGVDPVGNWSAVGETRIKVDRAAPELELGGSLTEQAKLGTQQSSYTLNYTAKDGDEAVAAAASPIGTPGTGQGQLERPGGVAVDASGNVWVSDANNNRVVEYDKNGAFIRQIGGTAAGSASGQFSAPRGVAIAPNGTVWVADSGNKRLQAFSSTGAFIRQVTLSDTYGGLGNPYAIAVAKDGSVWVSDNAAHRIRHFSEAGSFLGNAPDSTLVSVQGLAIDSFGNLWATEWESNMVYEFYSNGVFKFKFGGEGTGDGQFKSISGITTAPSGNIFVVDAGNSRIQEFKPDGTYLRQFGAAGSLSSQLNEPRGVAAGPGNLLYLGDAGNHRVARWAHADRHVESGVTKAEVKVDGVVQVSQNPGCATGKNCSLTGAWSMNADAFSAGKHKVEVSTTDGVALTTTKTLEVETHGDLTAPTIALSGTMTEQATLGSTRPTYKLAVSATDPGPTEERKSGVASTTIKVDGAVVDSATPGCSAGGCSITREWVLSSSSYSPGSHTVEVKATDAAGRSSARTLAINIARDTVAPEFANLDPFYLAPKGWVTQRTYRTQAFVTDSNGYGVTSVQLRVDGAVVLSATQSCPAGGCNKLFGSEPPIDMAKYSGGAHGAELIATDGAGNSRKKSWTIRVSPQGTIGTVEAENTFEAVDDTADLNTVGAAQTEEGLGGTAPGLELEEREFSEGEFEYISTGGAVVSTIDTDAAGGFSVSIPPEEAYEERCETNLAGEGQVLSGAQEESLAQSPPPDCNNAPLGESAPAQAVEVEPITLSDSAEDPSLSDADSASVSSNFRQHVDLVTRPLFDGAMTFAAIREPVAGSEFSWRVNLESDQQLTLLDPQHAAVYYDGGNAAFTINAIVAHDAIGTAVPTRLTVAGDVLTLIVDHQKGDAAGRPFTYPVVGGAGWEGGFQTYAIAMPPPELPEEEEENGEGAIVGGPTFKGGRPLVKSMTTGPPMPQPLSAPRDGLLPSPQILGRNVKKFKFTYCVPHNLPSDPAYDGGLFEDFFGVGTRKRSDGSSEVIGKNLPKIVSECHREDFEGVYWGVSVNGKFHYVENHWVWLFPNEWGCHKWGEEQPAKIHCKALVFENPRGENGVQAVHGPIWAIGEFRWPTMKGQWAAEARAACLTEGGEIYPNPRTNGTAPYERPMIWETEYVIAGAESCNWM